MTATTATQRLSDLYQRLSTVAGAMAAEASSRMTDLCLEDGEWSDDHRVRNLVAWQREVSVLMIRQGDLAECVRDYLPDAEIGAHLAGRITSLVEASQGVLAFRSRLAV